MKTALVTGCTGQDGSILCELLIERGYRVYATHRRTSVDNLSRLQSVIDKIDLRHCDLTSDSSVNKVIDDVQPDVIFNVADQDHVGWSHKMPEVSIDVTTAGVVRVLEAVRRLSPHSRVFQPVSATMFGMAEPPQHEETPFDPRSPYAICKLAAYRFSRMYRELHGINVSCGIMYNHDSPRRHGDYLLHAIAWQAVAIERGEQQRIKLGGSPETRVDIGCAREFMDAAIRIVELDQPDDFVIGTGIGHELARMCKVALQHVGIDEHVDNSFDRDDEYDRPGPVPTLIADINKARIAFDFNPKRDSLDVLRELIDFYRGR